jgi:hypothetical protein
MPPSGTLATVRIFKIRHFARWMRKTALTDEALRKAVMEMLAGLVDADLGGGILKKRIGIPGRGKRGGARLLVASNRGDRWIFVFGLMKNELDDIGDNDLGKLRVVVTDLLAQSDAQISQGIVKGNLEEISCGQETQIPEPYLRNGA